MTNVDCTILTDSTTWTCFWLHSALHTQTHTGQKNARSAERRTAV